jgi:hypothetical protein
LPTPHASFAPIQVQREGFGPTFALVLENPFSWSGKTELQPDAQSGSVVGSNGPSHLKEPGTSCRTRSVSECRSNAEMLMTLP